MQSLDRVRGLEEFVEDGGVNARAATSERRKEELLLRRGGLIRAASDLQRSDFYIASLEVYVVSADPGGPLGVADQTEPCRRQPAVPQRT